MFTSSKSTLLPNEREILLTEIMPVQKFKRPPLRRSGRKVNHFCQRPEAINVKIVLGCQPSTVDRPQPVVYCRSPSPGLLSVWPESCWFSSKSIMKKILVIVSVVFLVSCNDSATV